MILSGIKSPADIGAAIVGDTVAAVVGTPPQEAAALSFNVTRQPAGADIFSSGSNKTLANLSTSTFAIAGRYDFTCTGSNGSVMAFSILVWPAAALDVDRIKYLDGARIYLRQSSERRATLKALALAADLGKATTHIESTPGAPYFGTSPVGLGANPADNYTAFGGC